MNEDLLLVGMTPSAHAAIERHVRQQGRFRRFFVDTELDYGTQWGISLKVGSFRTSARLRGRFRSYKGLAATTRALTAQIRSASFQRNARHRRNKTRHFGAGKVHHAFR